MFVVHVAIHVKPGQLDAFLAVTKPEAVASRKDPGVVRFAILQHESDPERIVIAEVYESREAGLHHLETEHFKIWRAAIAPLVIAPPVATSLVPAP